VTGTASVGGLVGTNAGTVSNSHWNSTVNATLPGIGGGTTTGTNVSGLTTTQMQTASLLTGFNFTSTPGATGGYWVIVDADGTLNNAAGAAGAERTCRQADVGAVEVQTNALAKLRDHLFRQTGISARRADLST